MPPPASDERTSAATEAPANEYTWLLAHWHNLLIFSASLLLVASIAIFWSFRSKPARTSLPITNQESQAAHQVRVTGTTEAVRMQAIVAPMLEGQQFGSLRVTKLVLRGRSGRKSDLIEEFDRQAQLRNFIDKQDEYQKLANQAVQEQAKEDAARAKDETEIEQAEIDFKKAQIEMQKVELLSRIDAEKARQT